MKIQTIDWILYVVTFLLVAFGIVVIYSITYGQEEIRNFAQYQLIFASFGFVLMLFFSFLDYRFLKNIALPLFIISLFLLLLLLTAFGETHFGARRWLNFGFFEFQPSELLKLSLIFLLAKILDHGLSLKHFFAAIGLILLSVALVIKQPDFGTALIIFLTSMMIIFVAGFKKKYLIILTGLILIFFCLILLSVFSYPPFDNLLRDYQKERIESFLRPTEDPFGAGYNVSQSRIAIGSGGLLGRGLGYGPQSQLNFIPASQTDFIFAVAAEGFGFLGASILLSLFLIIFLRIARIIYKARDNFGTLLAYGFFAYFIFSVLVNIGMSMGIMPVTGIPLPLVSYGGTSLLISFSVIGICQSIMIRHKKIRF